VRLLDQMEDLSRDRLPRALAVLQVAILAGALVLAHYTGAAWWLALLEAFAISGVLNILIARSTGYMERKRRARSDT
jgi:hypothetical protein